MMTFPRIIATGLLALCCTGLMPSTQALAQQHTASSALTQDTMLLLSAYHELPEQARFEATGPGVEQELHRIILRDDVLRAHKYRALQALATYWPGAQTTALFESLFKSPDHTLMWHQLMVLASTHLSAEDATAMVAPLLTSKDEQLRYTAAGALGRIHTPESRTHLKRALETESNDWVKGHITQMLIEVK